MKPLILLLLIFSIFLIWQNQHLNPPLPKKTLEDYSNQILATCSKQDYPPSCYQKEIPKLMDPPINISMEDAFKVTGIVQLKDSAFSYCHSLAHELSAKETRKNLSSWLNIIPRCPVNSVCDNGCLHGTLQEKFRSDVLSDEQIETLKPDLAIACEPRNVWDPTGFERKECYHGLGHLSLYATGANFKKALEICDSIALKNDHTLLIVCYEGLFMQLFQPLEPEDEALVKGKVPKKETLRNFCLQFDGIDQQEACWIEGWALFREEVKTAEGIVKFCTTPSNPQKQNRCFSSLFHTTGRRLNFDTGKIIDLCNKIPEEQQGRCFAHAGLMAAIENKIFIDKATKLCSFAKTKGSTDDCFRILVKYANYNFHKGSSEFIQACNDLPEPWKTDCLK